MADAKKYKTVTLKGQVTGIFYNEVEEDDHGNNILPVVSIDKKYRVKLRNRKDKKCSVKKGDGWVDLNTGDTISIETKAYKTPKGMNYYGKVSDVELISSSSSGGSKAKSSGKFNKAYSSGGTKSESGYDEHQAGMSSGHAVTNAVSILAYSKQKITEESLKETAFLVAKVTKFVKESLLNGGPVKEEKAEAEEEDTDEDTEEDSFEEEADSDVEDQDDDSPF